MTQGTTQLNSHGLPELERKLAQMLAENREQELLSLVMELLKKACQENDRQRTHIQYLVRQLFGRKGERVSTSQLSLFVQAHPQAKPPTTPDTSGQEQAGSSTSSPEPSCPVETEATPPSQTTEKKKRSKLKSISQLPKNTTVIEVAAELRNCPTCGPRKPMGFTTSSVVRFVPSHFVVDEEKREKLGCNCLDSKVIVAPSERLFEGIRPSPQVMAQLLVHKLQDGMPIYRQTKEYERYGAQFPRSTLLKWIGYATEMLSPLIPLIKKEVLATGYIQLDDTGLKVQAHKTAEGIHRGHLWGAVGGRLVYFWYAPDWSATGPAQELSEYQGYAQVDAYAGYCTQVKLPDGRVVQAVKNDKNIGCAMHIRRAFFEAEKANDLRAITALYHFKRLYDLEESYRSINLSKELRYEKRQKYSLPIVNELYEWIREVEPKVIPKTPMAEAITYALNQEKAFRRCFEDGRFELDNGEIERHFKAIAVGRKAYLFAGSQEGAKRLAIGYTLVASCERNKINAYDWAVDALTKLARGWPNSRLAELLPNRWRASV